MEVGYKTNLRENVNEKDDRRERGNYGARVDSNEWEFLGILCYRKMEQPKLRLLSC